MHRAGADPYRLLVVEASPAYPRTYGYGEHRHALHVDEIDVLVESDAVPFVLEDAAPTEIDTAIAEHVSAFVPRRHHAADRDRRRPVDGGLPPGRG